MKILREKRKIWTGIVTAVLIVSLIANVALLTKYRAANQSQNQLGISLENTYQRSFLELSDDVEQIKLQLAQVLVSASREQAILGLANLWRAVYGALNSLNALPVVLEELEHTNAFLRDAAEYSYYLIRNKVLANEQMTAAEWSKLEEFYQRVRVVQQELSQIEAQILNESLRFTELTAEAEEENAILTAFRGIENRIDTFPVIELEEGVRKIEPEPRPISGELVDEETSLSIAQEFYAAFFDGEYTAQLEFTSEQSRIPIYGIRLYGKNSREPVYVEVSQHGGHILQMYQYRPIGQSVLETAAAEHAGEEFLQQMGFEDLALIDNISDGSSCDLTFVPVEDGVYIYSDMIKLMVALDTGEILSFDQTGYITRHYKRELAAPKLSEAEIRRTMNPNLQIESVRLALIADDYSENEYLTYEVRGEVVGEKFAVFVDAQTGLERRIVRLSKDVQYKFNTSD